MKRLLSHNPDSGVSCYFDQDLITGEILLSHEYADVSSNLDLAKEMRNDFGANQRKEEMWHLAHIPMPVISKWLLEDGINVFNKEHWPQVRRKLNDPDYAYLRVSPGKA